MRVIVVELVRQALEELARRSSCCRRALPVTSPSSRDVRRGAAGAPPRRRPAVDSASPAMFASDAPIASRSSARPLTNRCSCDQQLDELAVAVVDRPEHLVEVVDGAPDHLVAVGEGAVSEAVCPSRRLDVAALALQGLDDLEGERLTSSGRSAANSGLKPLNSTVRSSAGCGPLQRDGRPSASGSVEPGCPR